MGKESLLEPTQFFFREVDVSEGCRTSTHSFSSLSSSSGSGGSSSGSFQASTTFVPVLGSSDTDDEDTESCSDIEEEREDNAAEFVENDLFFVSEWSSSTTDAHAVIEAQDLKACTRIRFDAVHVLTFFNIFLQVLPLTFLKTDVLKATNEFNHSLNFTEAEMLDFIVLHQIMSFYPGHKRTDFFQISKDSAESFLHGTLSYLGKYISRNQFDKIVSFLKLAPLSAKPSSTDCMWEIQP